MVIEDDAEAVDKCIDVAMWMKLMDSAYEAYVGDRESVVRLMIDTAAAESLKQRKRESGRRRQGYSSQQTPPSPISQDA